MDSRSSINLNHPPTRQSLRPVPTLDYFHRSSYPPQQIIPPLQSPFTPTSSTSSLDGGSYPQFALPSFNPYYDFNTPCVQPMQISQSPQHYAPQPSRTQSYDSHIVSTQSHGGLQDIRPMPVGGSNNSPSQASPYVQESPPKSNRSQAGAVQSARVVGTQGRRGILPSAVGCPVAAADGSPSGQNPSPPKRNLEGKWPCEFCHKSYLHAKHLKRHGLRHSGVRPYTCPLCLDTFSRSDILKRHFQKCSIRRGNPTGATHLSYPQANIRKSKSRSNKKATSSDVGFSTTLTESPSSESPNTARFPQSMDNAARSGLGQSECLEQYQSLSTPVTRSNSIKRQRTRDITGDRGNFAGPSSSGFEITGFRFSPGESSPDSLTSSNEASPFSFPEDGRSKYLSNLPPSPNDDHTTHSTDLIGSQMTYLSNLTVPAAYDGHDINWNTQLNLAPNTNYTHSTMPSNVMNGQQPIKLEADLSNTSFASVPSGRRNPLLNGAYEAPISLAVLSEGTEDNPRRIISIPQIDPMQHKVQSLISFCFPGDSDSADDQMLKQYLSAYNIKHFLDLFSHFQGHWPTIHAPTFDPAVAYDGLVLAMVCLGAVYSDILSISQVRTLMQHAKLAIDRTTRVFDHGLRDDYGGKSDCFRPNIEEVQALVLLQVLFIWHGDPAQREHGRHDFTRISMLAYNAGLLHLAGPTHPAYSIFHQKDGPSQDSLSSWTWLSWVEQEKWSRLLYILFLLDGALVIFFNHEPRFDPQDILLPLPADDVAWEATSAVDCAAALGLHGHSAQSKNTTGSGASKQLEMNEAMRRLLDPTCDFKPCISNAYSKFILVHGLHIQIWKIQRQLLGGTANFGLQDFRSFDNLSKTPNFHSDWMVASGGSGRTSSTSSGQLTPNDSSGAQTPNFMTPHLLRNTTYALQKWKKMWDEDMAIQYPSTASPTRRLGFCRDGIHYYYLACTFLHKRASDWDAPPDVRFSQVMSLLKNEVLVRVSEEKSKHGQEIGSVGSIDESYGAQDLTIDMKLLFTPLG